MFYLQNKAGNAVPPVSILLIHHLSYEPEKISVQYCYLVYNITISFHLCE